MTAIWKELATDRQGSGGLGAGFDYGGALQWPSRIQATDMRDRMKAILQDGVWTPRRAARAGNASDVCSHCGQEQADVVHLWWECTGLHRRQRDAGRPLRPCARGALGMRWLMP